MLTKYTAIIAIVKVNKFDSLQASLRDAIRKRMRGTAIAVEGARESLKKPIFYGTHSPSPDFVGSSLPEGAYEALCKFMGVCL